MTTFHKLALLSLAALLPAAAQAEPRIYAYDSPANYCPQGLQPIQINGVICCGTPNQPVSYQSMMRENSTRRSTYRASRAICPEGQKGCYMQ
ncbi:hypothetical protein TG4357_03140 [Thalassovita gelatinovora]|uniref:Integral membrane protein n=1 Tax=Thalassovita gelatinovora TaxID=53501 RepID=A0A0P1G7T3_THAGE|nr:hypothetical protein [Thalassovita gelatinovora]QIZ82109.1 hypothetical protein HFZ77_17315 [Thalassovita gelatinovora]CUH67669.1 hypothetical protein TG4357_03140 [Thalassovita gelatinovora]SEP69704.1 hypothetical protein SAMN04488043_101120 [Thalassovita gelatinovora]